ncbi:hypothetical protein [Halorussus aquaticus]|uniref:Uncharacterized protein n=1 Tax=Halorussus aquaticus TaxID=2953748 RepID=A0ABD5Q811_9EURY|nr:hypothetical protein [Halorussus aquaticus]
MKEYLRKDLDFHAVALLSDGIDWELWVRPRHQPLPEDAEPYSYISLRKPIGDVKARNLENESYHPHDVRGKIDNSTFENFTASALNEVLQSEFDLDPVIVGNE